MPVLRELFNDMWKKFQDRPRFLSFEPSKSSTAPMRKGVAAGGSNREAEEPFFTFKENPQYPISRPQYEGLTPHEYHQQLLEKETERANSYLARRIAEMAINKIGHEYSPDPVTDVPLPVQRTEIVYNKSVIFR